jgi:hypothetical protein
MMFASLVLTPLLLASVQDGLPRGHCTFASEGVGEVLDALMACGDERRPFELAAEALVRHTYWHGWSTIDGIDLVPPDRAAACPSRVLDLLARVTVPCAHAGAVWVRQDLAQSLERNGRIDEALRILVADLDEMLAEPPQVYSWGIRYDSKVSFVAEHAARIAAKHGRLEQALVYASHWRSTAMCGWAADGELTEIRRFRANCLLQLGRHDELRRLCIEGVTHENPVDLHLVEPWIDSHHSGPRPIAPELAVELLAAFLEPSRADELRAAAGCWFARRLPPTEQLRHLEDLDPDHAAPFVIPLLLQASNDEIAELIAPLLGETVTRADCVLATWLAHTGHPLAAPALDNLVERNGESFRWFRDRWRGVREHLDALAAGP